MNARQLHVAFDNSLTRDNLAGTGVYASHLLQEIATYPDLDVQVFNGVELGSTRKGFAARAVRSLANRYGNPVRLSALLRKGNFDLMHGPAFIVPLNCPCASVVTVYDLTFRLFPEHFEGRWTARVASRLPPILQSVSAVICISEQTKQDLLNFYRIAPEKVHVVYCGVDRSRYHPGIPLDPNWARTLGLRDGYILHVGSLAARKNIPALLRAVAILRSQGKWGSRQVVLAGSKTRGLPGASEVYETIQRLGLVDLVILPGH
ncbi:MAG: glycosyltransferase, partial [Terriglobales bacterium]